ncbi:MAG: hypothetical protein PHI06_14975 [Desulfobulbaceae bacterium]|nr:hypothetical protein [Desulfobulbaceae bacterium]
MDKIMRSNTDISGRIEGTTLSLFEYCKKNDWSGFDPYDALNSRVFARTPFSNSRICRIAITQILKRLPINIRPLLLVSKEQNPKAIALFLMAILKLSKLRLSGQDDLVGTMVEKLVALRSQDTPYWCWGYSFPWQTRTIIVPRGAPNVVCTTFVANALLDAYESRQESRCLSMAVSAADYIYNELYWSEGSSIAGFSYPLPGLRTRVHNANFLGAALFCRIYKHSGEKKFLEPALKVTRYSAAKQHDDGSWDYGELSKQSWVDNFHTGYNLCALRSIGENAGTSEFEPHLIHGFEFYRKYFFREDSAPRYFHNRTYPIDIHSVAQSIITFLILKDLAEDGVDAAHSIFEWTMKNMWDEQGYFYYQARPLYKNKISYMRWSQAWMLLALATLLEECKQGYQARVLR